MDRRMDLYCRNDGRQDADMDLYCSDVSSPYRRVGSRRAEWIDIAATSINGSLRRSGVVAMLAHVVAESARWRAEWIGIVAEASDVVAESPRVSQRLESPSQRRPELTSLAVFSKLAQLGRNRRRTGGR